MLNLRFILRVRVQGLVGVVTLTLFDREFTDMLKLSAASLVEKCEKDDNSNEYPFEVTKLLDKKYAFKGMVGKFNFVKNVRYYNVSKITDYVDIISWLDIMEKKLSNDQTNNTNRVAKELKMKLIEVYDMDALESESETKIAVKPFNESKATTPIKLLIPKVEK
ncbi:hypothetical protein LXL04_023459 [Taraxacum kok-saghyz]